MSTDSKVDTFGTCMTMCPAAEISMREKNNLLHYFEMVPGTERDPRPRASHTQMVKEYTRSAAGKEDARAPELRSLKALRNTVNYLTDMVVPRTDRPWNFVYDFVFDRFRAVRQDMVIQRMDGPQTAAILEKIIRFHLFSSYRLCTEPAHKFDPTISDTHTQECLKWLLVLYEEGGCAGRGNMPEMVALYLLYNLGNTEALLHGLARKRLLCKNQHFRLALEMNCAALVGNYVRVFRGCRKLPAIYQCAVSHHIPRLQNEALLVMSSAFHKLLRYPTAALCDLLLFDYKSDVETHCSSRGLSVNEKGVLFDKTAYAQLDKCPLRRFRFIDESLQMSTILDLIHGRESEPQSS